MQEQILYKIVIEGEDNFLNALTRINSQTAQIKNTIKELKKEQQAAFKKEDAEAVSAVSKKIEEQNLSLQRLQQERKEIIKLSKQNTTIIAEEGSTVSTITNSYNVWIRELKELRSNLRNMNQELQPDEFKALEDRILSLSEKVNNFNRRLSPDGTLVGEYRRGIINAFADLNLVDLATQKFEDLKNEQKKAAETVKELGAALEKANRANITTFAPIGFKFQAGDSINIPNINTNDAINSLNNLENKTEQSFGNITQEGRQAATEINEALTKIGFSGVKNVKDLEKAFLQATEEAKKLGKEVDNTNIDLAEKKVGSSVGTKFTQALPTLVGGNAGLGLALGEVAGPYGAAAGLIAGATADIAISFTNAQRKGEQYQNMLKAAAQGNYEGAKSFEYVNNLAEKYGLNLEVTTTSYAKFLAAAQGKNVDAEQLFEQVTVGVTALNLSVEDSQGIFTALEQILSKGKVSAEELRGQLGERLPGAFGIAARAIGVTEEKLNDMLQKGKVISEDFLPKFAQEIEKTYIGSVQAGATSLNANINRINNEVFKLKNSVTGVGGAIGALSSNFASLLGYINKIGEIKLSEKLETERQAFSGLALQVQQTNITKEQRLALITRMQAIAPSFLKNINTEKVTNEQLSEAIKKVNDNYIIKIALTRQDEKRQDFENERLDTFTLTNDALEKLNVTLAKGAELAKIDLNELVKVGDTPQQVSFLKEKLEALAKANEGFFEKALGAGDYTGAKVEINALYSIYESSKKRLNEYDKESIQLTQKQQKEVEALQSRYGKLVDEVSAPKKALTPTVQVDNEALAKKQKEAVKIENDFNTILNEIQKQRIEKVRSLEKEAYDPKNLKDIEEYYEKEKNIIIQKYKEIEESKLSGKNFTPTQITTIKSELNQTATVEINELQLKKQKEEYELLNKQTTDFYQNEVEITQKAYNEILTLTQLTEYEKTQISISQAETLLQLKIKENADLLELEKKYGVQSAENEKKRASEILQIQNDTETQKALLKKQAIEQAFSNIDIDFNIDTALDYEGVVENIKAVANSEILTKEEKTKRIEKIENASQSKILQLTIETTQEKIRLLEELPNRTQEQNDQLLGLQEKLGQNEIALIKRTNEQKIEEERKTQNEIAKIRDTAISGVESIISKEISLKVKKSEYEAQEQQEVLDREKEKQLQYATSEEEKQIIEQQFANKKEEIQRQQRQKEKQAMLAQAKIDLASGILKVYLKNTSVPFPFNIALSAIEIGLLLANYSQAIREINAQQLEQGGFDTKVLETGGKFGGRRHAQGGNKYLYNNTLYEAETGELAVINRNSASSNTKMTITGTPTQIASAVNKVGGGIDFMPGAYVAPVKMQFGGFVGIPNSSYIANAQVPRFESNNGDSMYLQKSVEGLKDLVVQTQNSLLNMRVTLNPNDVTNYQNNSAKSVQMQNL